MRAYTRKYLVFGLVLMVCFFFTTYASGQTKVIELNYSHQYPAPHKSAILAVEWAKEIEKRTNGRVKITVFPANTLVPADKSYQSVVNGTIDVGSSTLGYSRGRFPVMEVIDLPLGYKSATAAMRLANDVYNRFKPKELDDTKVMYFFAHGPGFFHSKKPINKLEDFKGMKMRCTGLSAKVVGALGGTPVAMPMPETYDALSRGIVDGSVAPMEALSGWKWGEVVKFTTQSYGAAYSAAFFVVMNKNKWNALPPDIQKIIETVNGEYLDKAGAVWDLIDKEGTDYTVKLGNKIITLSQEEDARWVKAVRPLLDEYVKNAKSKGQPGDEILKFALDRLK
jgi:TRAP-type C4-dicarboxylate transport system substrate-binding protein